MKHNFFSAIGKVLGIFNLRAPALLLWVALSLPFVLAASLLQACGGGSLSTAGVGSGGTGIATGTVSGFGSVIVDGFEYNDDLALRTAELKLGQQVRVRYSGNNIAESVEVMPQLIGPVAAAVDANGWMLVMGQWVRLIRSGDPVTRSSPTVLGGYTKSDDIVSGDEVEVHGSWVFDASKSAYVVMATRVEKLSVRAASVQLGGVVQSLTDGAFRLSQAGGTQVQTSLLPSGLANGEVVQVYLARSALGSAPVLATAVLRTSLTAQDVSGKTVRVSGLATGYNPVSRTVQVQGMNISLDAAVDVDVAALAQGAYVSLQLDSARGASGPLQATAATVRGLVTHSNNADLGATVELKGNVSGIDWAAPLLSFSLRGTTVQAVQAALDASCIARSPGAATYVQLTGRLQSAGQVVTAERVQCSNP